MLRKPKKQRYYQGIFKCIHPKKYVGNVNNIQYRSFYEFKYMRQLDHDPTVLSWSSEEMHIEYVSPVDGRPHRYFPDMLVKKQTLTGPQTFLIEIKPSSQTHKPKQSRNRARMINETNTYRVNQAKWNAAEEWCKRNGVIFQILTEVDLKI